MFGLPVRCWARFHAELVAFGISHDGVAAMVSHHGGAQFPKPGHLSRHRPGSLQIEVHPVLAALALGHWINQMFGSPHPAASTKALLVVESSSTSDPNTAAQNVASAKASPASNVTDLMTVAICGA